jgi:hypothetical protein
MAAHYFFAFSCMRASIRTTVSKKRAAKKRAVAKRNNRLDPNNNKNLPGHPVIKRRGKKVSDDGFEHRTSRETV